MTTWLPVVGRELCAERLRLVFSGDGFDSIMSSQMAATIVAALIYAGCVQEPADSSDESTFARPSTITWLREEVLRDHTSIAERAAYIATALGTKASERVEALMISWGITAPAWYRDNTRESIRDDLLRVWLAYGPVLDRPGIKTTSPAPRWMLRRSFADLFNPALSGTLLLDTVDMWRRTHLSGISQYQASALRQLGQAEHAVDVLLPTGESRRLEPGDASRILKGVIEQWAPRRMRTPAVVAISEPGTKAAVIDEQVLALLGVHVAVSTLLPDAILADIGASPVQIWVIEAVATDGPVTEDRKKKLIAWAESQNLPTENMQFLSAFLSRNAGPARRRLKDLAAGTFAWYLAEPGFELTWGPIQTRGAPNPAVVTSLRPR